MPRPLVKFTIARESDFGQFTIVYMVTPIFTIVKALVNPPPGGGFTMIAQKDELPSLRESNFTIAGKCDGNTAGK